VIESKELVTYSGIELNAVKRPNDIAIISGQRRLTWYELNERTNRVANGLLDMGLKKGDKVTILLFNGNEMLELSAGLNKAGLVIVPMNFRNVGKEITYQVNNSDSKAFVLGEEFIDRVWPIRNEFELVAPDNYVVIGEQTPDGAVNYEDLLARADGGDPGAEVGENDPAVFIYTSGTTGHPKGAVRSHRGVVLMTLFACAEYGFTENEINLSAAPLFHSAPAFFANTHLYIGATVCTLKVFDPVMILEAIERERITNFFMAPTMYDLILSLPDEEKKKYDVGIVTNLRPRDQRRKLRCVGQPFFGADIKLFDADGNEVGPGEVGEIYVSNPNLMQEYYKNPEATEKGKRGRYISVGDMARCDEEGYYYIVDRRQDMIISGGSNIYPAEIEGTLHSHPKIMEAAVIGVPNERWGESIKAIVVLKPGESATEEEIIEYCKANAADYKKPRSVDFVDELPRNPSGKILKRILREPYWKDRNIRV